MHWTRELDEAMVSYGPPMPIALCNVYATLTPQRQSWVVLVETVWLAMLKIFTIWPFWEKACWALGRYYFYFIDKKLEA